MPREIFSTSSSSTVDNRLKRAVNFHSPRINIFDFSFLLIMSITNTEMLPEGRI